MSPVMWPRMRDDYEPGSADPGQSLVKSADQDAWEPGAEPGGGGGGGGAVDSVNGKTGTVVLSASDVGAATAAQGAFADTAVQPGDLADVATSGAYGDLSGRPTIPSAPGDVGAAPAVHTHTAADVSGLADVATSGSYGDLTDKPTIPAQHVPDPTAEPDGRMLYTASGALVYGPAPSGGGGGGDGSLDATGQPSGHVPTAQGDDTWEWEAQTGAVSHESILLDADATLPATHPVLTVRATAAATVDVEDAPDGTVVTVHVAEGWDHITWAAGIAVTGETDTTETWVVLVRAEGAWTALVSGEPEPASMPDTGVVDVNGLVNDTDWYRSWGVVEVRRIGSMVTLSLDLYTRATWTYATNSAILTLPVGYRPSSTVVGLLHKPDSGGTISLRASSSGGVEAQRGSVPISDGGGLAAYLTYMTDDPWPA